MRAEAGSGRKHGNRLHLERSGARRSVLGVMACCLPQHVACDRVCSRVADLICARAWTWLLFCRRSFRRRCNACVATSSDVGIGVSGGCGTPPGRSVGPLQDFRQRAQPFPSVPLCSFPPLRVERNGVSRRRFHDTRHARTDVVQALPSGSGIHTALSGSRRTASSPGDQAFSCNSLLRLRGGHSGTGVLRFPARSLGLGRWWLRSPRLARDLYHGVVRV